MRDSELGARYTATAVALHWLIAVAVAGMIFLGWWMLSVPKDPPGPRVRLFNLHKSIGITVFVLMLVRLEWRLTHRPPALPMMPAWQAGLARANHFLLYACLFAMPVAGFLASSFSGRPIVYFGVALPQWAARNDTVSSVFYGVHFVVSWVLMAAIGLHVLAAIKHQWIDRDRLLRRMGWHSADANLARRLQ